MTDSRNFSVLDKYIIGRVTPHIYAFTTGTVPEYLKVGDTYRTVERRLGEWRKVYPDLEEQCRHSATINENVYFRDHSVHSYLMEDLGRERLTEDKVSSGTYHSREFFRAATAQDVKSAIHSIHESYNLHSERYTYYDASTTLPRQNHYGRSNQQWQLRPNQQDAVEKFCKAVEAGRTNLLLYAVMRFGKSYTSLECAKSINAKTVVVVSAKADVESEWRKTTEVPANFSSFYFLNRSALDNDAEAIKKVHDNSETAVVFLTLQDLQGDQIKARHKQIFSEEVDLLIIDESHYGARAEEYGKVLRTAGLPEETKAQKVNELADVIDPDKAGEAVKAFNAKIRLHLSGTPYRILMGSEFAPDDIIAFVQFTDIVRAQEEWDQHYLNHDGVNEWDNPYFGFPQMVRFAFNLNESARARLKELGEYGTSAPLSTLLQPCSVKKDTKSRRHTQFIYEQEVLDLLRVIDGTQHDGNILGFLDYDKIKDGNMCRHLVMVLPYKASCDAMEQLLNSRATEFKNLGDYRVINIAGLDAQKKHRTPETVKQAIVAAEKVGQKTITLTVNKMLTGSTVEQWDTMLFLKETSSPQEYDQAIFRLQNQYVRELQPQEHQATKDEATIKHCLKPQTILVDFDPTRMFRLQEQRALFANVNTNERGNDRLEESLSEELRISPIITMNADRIQEVHPTDILQAVSNYNARRSISDEVMDVPVDLNILKNESLRDVINRQAELGSKASLELSPHEGKQDDLEFDDPEDNQRNNKEASEDVSDDANQLEKKGKKSYEELSQELKIRTYYQRILFFAMLAQTELCSLGDIINSGQEAEHPRILKNLGLEIADLMTLKSAIDPLKLNQLDYKIQNINRLGRDESLPPIDRAKRAIGKFSRLSGSEVRTPSWLCDQMISVLNADRLKRSIESGHAILDIASKFGEFSIAAYAYLINELGMREQLVEDAIYSIPTSGVAYEFTRHFYRILGMNTANIAQKFTSYDLLQFVSGDGINKERLNAVVRQPAAFDEIDLERDPLKGAYVKFAAIVGNPPFQRQDKGEGTGSSPIYPDFIEISHSLSDFVVLIHPARFLFNAGKTSKSWNRRFLSNRNIAVAKYWDDAAEVFENRVDIKGGVAITILDRMSTLGPIGQFIPNPILRDIVKAVSSKAVGSFAALVYPRDLYKLSPQVYAEKPFLIGAQAKGHEYDLGSNVFLRLPDIFSDASSDEFDAAVVGREKSRRITRFVPSRYLRQPDNFDSFKIILPKSNGAGKIGEALSSPQIAPPHTGHTVTFLSIGKFDTEIEAAAALAYLKTKFVRVLLGSLKVTQDNPRPVWENVPLEDFSPQSDIDWSQDISEIDNQLYRKYCLTGEQIRYIERVGVEMS